MDLYIRKISVSRADFSRLKLATDGFHKYRSVDREVVRLSIILAPEQQLAVLYQQNKEHVARCR